MRTRSWTTAAAATGLCLALMAVCHAQDGADAGVVRLSDASGEAQPVDDAYQTGEAGACMDGEWADGACYGYDAGVCQGEPFCPGDLGCRQHSRMLTHGEAPCPHMHRTLRGTALMAAHVGLWPARAAVAALEGRHVEMHGPISTYLMGGRVMAPDYGYSPPAKSPIRRVPIRYTNFYPDPWYGSPRPPAATPAPPQIYTPTDTTQLGFYYHQVPVWEPRPWMLPPDPTPGQVVTRESGVGVEPVVYRGTPLGWHHRHFMAHWHGTCPPPQGYGHGPLTSPCGSGFSHPYCTVHDQVAGTMWHYEHGCDCGCLHGLDCDCDHSGGCCEGGCDDCATEGCLPSTPGHGAEEPQDARSAARRSGEKKTWLQKVFWRRDEVVR